MLAVLITGCDSKQDAPFGFKWGQSVNDVESVMQTKINCLYDKKLIISCRTKISPSGDVGDFILTFNNYTEAVGLVAITTQDGEVATKQAELSGDGTIVNHYLK